MSAKQTPVEKSACAPIAFATDREGANVLQSLVVLADTKRDGYVEEEGREDVVRIYITTLGLVPQPSPPADLGSVPRLPPGVQVRLAQASSPGAVSSTTYMYTYTMLI